MRLFELRKKLKGLFKEKGIDEADVDYIASEVLNMPRTELVLLDCVDDQTAETIMKKATMRLNNVPVDKIFNRSYFYGLTFRVDKNVLSPRPETEQLVEVALKYIKQNNYKNVLDLCTGSGCLAVAIKKNANVVMTASDISRKALQIAKYNAKANNVEIDFVYSNMFDKLEGKFDFIVTNPPYIDTEEIEFLSKEVRENDPHIALDGGEFGLKYYNIIHDNLRKHLIEGGMIAMEIGEDQKELILSLFNDFELVESIKDYAGQDRILVFKR